MGLAILLHGITIIINKALPKYHEKKYDNRKFLYRDITTMRYLLIFSLMFIAVACQSKPDGIFGDHSHPENQVLAFDDPDDLSYLVWAYATELKYEKHLRLEQALVCAEPDRSKIKLEFSSQDILELCPARQLLVDVVEGLLDRINLSAVSFQLRPIPFVAENVEIRINFESYYGIYVDPTYIGWIVLEDGMAYYYGFDLKDYRHVRQVSWSTRYEAYSKSRAFAYAQRAAEEQYQLDHPVKRKLSVLGEEQYGSQIEVNREPIPINQRF